MAFARHSKALRQSMAEVQADQAEAQRRADAAVAAAAASAGQEESDEDEHLTMLLLSTIPNELIAQMQEFGFPFQTSARALLQSRLGLESAVSHVLASNAETLESPFSRAELRMFAGWYLPSAISRSEGSVGHAAAAEGTSRRPPEHQQLLEMGFAPSQVRHAIRGADGNAAEACAALLGDAAALKKIEARNADLLWLDPLEQGVIDGSLSAQGVLDCADKIVTNPQAVLDLWYDRNPTFLRICEIFTDLKRRIRTSDR
jgi:hypothetical protein